MEWYDQYLSWNASEYGDLDLYFFPQDDVWKPDVALRNSVEKYKSLGVSTLNVQVQSNGYVMWYPFEVNHDGGLYMGFKGYSKFAILLTGVWDTIHFTFRDMGYCVQYFGYFQGY